MFSVTDLDDRSRSITTGSAKLAREYFDAIGEAGGTALATFTEFKLCRRVFRQGRRLET